MANKIVWFDIPVTNLPRAMTFYRNVLNTELKEDFPGVAVFAHEQGEVSGCLFISNNAKPSDSGVLIYFNVDGRLQEAVDAVEKSGGKIVEGPHEIGPFGSRAIILDSEGNRIALHSE